MLLIQELLVSYLVGGQGGQRALYGISPPIRLFFCNVELFQT